MKIERGVGIRMWRRKNKRKKKKKKEEEMYGWKKIKSNILNQI